MNEQEKALLNELYGCRMPSQLEIEIFTIIRAFDVHRYAAKDAAKDAAEIIYKHLQDNVMNSTDLMNYEAYRTAQMEK